MGLLADIQGLQADTLAAATANGAVAAAQTTAAAAAAKVTQDTTQLVTDLTAAPYNGVAAVPNAANPTTAVDVYTSTPGATPPFSVQTVQFAS